MTNYTFSPSNTNYAQNWDSASIWSPAGVPNGGTAVVTLPEIFNSSTGAQVSYAVQIQPGESFQASAVDVGGDTLSNSGSLAVANELVVGSQGDLYNSGTNAVYSAGFFENRGLVQSQGQLTVSGEAVNRGDLYGSETISATRFENLGRVGGYQTTLVIAPTVSGGFVNLSGGTLTGGNYLVETSGTIDIQVNGPITTLAATVQYVSSSGSSAGALQTYAASGTSYVPLTSSLAAIAPSGFLDLQASSYANAGALTLQGDLTLAGASSFSASSLTIAAGGTVTASSFGNASTLSASGGIVDNGAIIALIDPETEGGGVYANSTLQVTAAVTGNGFLVVGAGQSYDVPTGHGSLSGTAAVTLELAAAASANVVFADTTGILQLDAPQAFTGTIKSFAQGDTIILSGLSLSSVISTSYSGDSTHGVLTLVESGGTVTLAFQGNYATSSFSLTAGVQPLSSSPASIVITDAVAGASPNENAAAAIASPQAGAVVVDAAGDVAQNLDGLQALKAAGDLSAIVLTDLTSELAPVSLATLTLTATQFLNDAGALSLVAGAYQIDVGGAAALQAESIAGGSHVAAIAVTDSAADVAAQIDQLGALAAKGQVSSIALTDSGFVPFTLSSAQFAADRTAFEDMTGHYTLTINATAANATIEGITGIGTTVAFSGAAGEYALAAQGDGIGLTVSDTGTGRTSTDNLRTVTAVTFSDVTDFVAQIPGSGAAGAVTTGNVTELYGAVFGRLPDVPGLAYYQGVLAANPALPLTTFAQWFLASPEYTGNAAHNYAQSSAGDSQFITDCYQNLLHRAPESGAIPYYLAIIDTFTNGQTAGSAAYAAAQTLGHAYVLTDFSASAEFLNDVQVTAQHPSSAQHWLILI